MAIHIYAGLPGSGKSTKMADLMIQLCNRNLRHYKKTGIARQVVTNIAVSDWVKSKYHGLIAYWEDPSELVKMKDCDIFWDEIATYLDSTQWQNVPIEIKRFLQQHRKRGIDIYGNTQDFAMVDISMRRLVKKLYVCTKVIGSRDLSATRKPVKNPWGIILLREVERKSFTDDMTEYTYTGIFDYQMLFITKKLTSVFDTQQEIVAGKYPPLRHIRRECSDPNCDFHRITHI